MIKPPSVLFAESRQRSDWLNTSLRERGRESVAPGQPVSRVASVTEPKFYAFYPIDGTWVILAPNGNNLPEQGTNHYLNQWWPSSLTHICGTRGRWVDESLCFEYLHKVYNSVLHRLLMSKYKYIFIITMSFPSLELYALVDIVNLPRCQLRGRRKQRPRTLPPLHFKRYWKPHWYRNMDFKGELSNLSINRHRNLMNMKIVRLSVRYIAASSALF